jgi:intein/homing endonuclease
MCDYLGLRMNITKNSFVIYSKELYDYLLPLGYSNEKYIPSEVFTLNKECLNIFLDNYVRGDGHERTHGRYNSVERSVFTSSVRLRDDLSYLILLCGYCPSISLHSHKGTIVEHKNGTYTQNYDIYGIRINSSKYATYSGLTVDRVDYDDYTYCVELPKYHTLWVMRNGKTSWNGNCRCTAMFNYD